MAAPWKVPPRTDGPWGLIEEYLAERDLSPSWCVVARKEIGSLLRHIDGDLRRISEDVVGEWIAVAPRTNGPRTPRMERWMLGYVRPFIRWLAANGHVDVEGFGQKAIARPGTLAPLIAEYLRQRRRQGRLSRSSAMRAGYTLTGLDASFGKRPMSSFGTRAVERWIEQHPQWQPRTRRTYLSHVRLFTTWLLRNGHIAKDPFDEIDTVKIPRPVPRPIDRCNIDKLLAAAPDSRGRLIVQLQFSMGLRCVGCANLRIEDIDHVSKVLIVSEKFGNERRLPITPTVAHAIDAYLRECPALSGPLLRSYRCPWKGIQAQHIGSMISQWMRDAGVKITAHDGRSAHALRHTALTNLAESSGDAFIVQELAGWASTATAVHYVRRASTERLREALAKRDAAR